MNLFYIHQGEGAPQLAPLISENIHCTEFEKNKMTLCVSSLKTPYEEDEFLGCYRCGADEDQIEESPHPDVLGFLKLQEKMEVFAGSWIPSEDAWNEAWDKLTEVEKDAINGTDGESYIPETLWCRNCGGRVNEDYDLFVSGKATWEFIPG